MKLNAFPSFHKITQICISRFGHNLTVIKWLKDLRVVHLVVNIWLFFEGGVVRVKKLSRSGISLYGVWRLMWCRHLPVIQKVFCGTVCDGAWSSSVSIKLAVLQ